LNESIREKLSNVIDIPENISDPEELLKQKITIIKGIDEKIALSLKNILKISTVEGLAIRTISNEEYRMLKFLGIDMFDLNIWQFVSKVIAENKIEEYLQTNKISIVGLNYAGKTAISKIMKKKLNIDLFINDVPTIGAEYSVFNKLGLEYLIVDMGGQNLYRKQYIQDAEKYFFNISLLIYVVDVQDSERFEESINFFKDIIKTLKLLKEKPEVMILINKVDPDIRNDKKILSSINFLKYKFKNILEEQEFLNYEIKPYSIFNALGNNKTIIKEIREFASRTPSKESDNKDFEKKYEKILNMFIELSSKIEERLSKIEEKIDENTKWIEGNKKKIEENLLAINKNVNLTQLQSDDQKAPQTVESLNVKINQELKKLIKGPKKEKLFQIFDEV